MPSILHATWLPSEQPPFSGKLFLWAEETNFSASPSTTVLSGAPHAPGVNDQQPSTTLRTAEGRAEKTRAEGKQRPAQIPSHPQQMTLSQLRGLLPQQFPGLPITEAQLTSAVVWLPSHSGAPSSRRAPFVQHLALRTPTTPREEWTSTRDPSLLRGDDTAQLETDDAVAEQPAPHDTRLMAWQVTGLALTAKAALDLLTHFAEDSALHGGAAGAAAWQRSRRNLWQQLRAAPDLTYWSHAAKFALELLIGQHYVPGLYTDALGNFAALWQPTLNDPQIVERFDQLTAHMPPLCRAYNLEAPEQATSAKALLEDFITTLVDVSVRSWATTDVKQPLPGAPDAALHFASTAERSTPAKAGGHQWLWRLRTAERRLDLPPQPGHQLYQDVTNWLEQLHTTGDANFRICFALETPEDSQTSDASNLRWKLSYYLQARDNPSLLIPARQIWQSKGNVLKVHNRRIDQPQERLLAGLGAVSHLFAPIERSLRKVQPDAAFLSTEEAHQFLREVGPLLANSGFGIIFPDWWRSRGQTQLGLHLHLRAPSAGDDYGELEGFTPHEQERVDYNGHAPSRPARLGFGAPIHYSWELSIGGQALNRQEFERLAALQAPLVRVGNRWIELDAAQVQSARRFLDQRAQSGSMSFLQALRLAQSWQADAEGLQSHRASELISETLDLDDEMRRATADDEFSDVDRGAYRKGNLQTGDDDAALALSADDLPFDLGAAPSSLALDGVDVDGYLQFVFEQLKQQTPDMTLTEPAGFVGQLRPYQRRGLAWLHYLRTLGLGGCLADDMGLGKTIQAIALHLHTRHADDAVHAAPQQQNGAINGAHPVDEAAVRRPTLLICPTSVMANWRHEVERFAPALRVLVHHGNGRLAGDEFVSAITRYDFIITSYGTARRDIDLLLQHVWDDVILDEAQNIKNPNAKQSQAVRRIQAHNRVALTGTPVENHLSELWSIVHFLNPGYLGGFERFRKRYIVPIERYNDDERAAQLRRLVQPILLRRLKTDPAIISDLPEKNEMIVYCSLADEQRQLYNQVVQQSLDAIDQSSGLQRRGLVLGLITKLKQICNHPAHYLKSGTEKLDIAKMRRSSGKLSRLHDMLEEALAAGDQALIFTQFVEMGNVLQSYLAAALGVDVLFLHGGTPARNRERMVQHFQSEDGPPIFILSLRAGGFGLNLTRANRVFHFDRWWNPAIENQATDRAFRIGQQRNVQVHKFVTAGTLEERIHEMIESKLQLAEQIMGSGEEWLTEMDTEELRSLLLFHE